VVLYGNQNKRRIREFSAGRVEIEREGSLWSPLSLMTISSVFLIRSGLFTKIVVLTNKVVLSYMTE
jgi:hypothetical protein